MKTLILGLLFSTSTLACQYAEISCAKPTASFDLKKVQGLEEKVERYHNLLSIHSHPKSEWNSCFNNSFALTNLRHLKKDMKKNGKVCMEYRWRIVASVKSLINPSSLENRSVENEAVKAKLEYLAEEIESEAKDI